MRSVSTRFQIDPTPRRADGEYMAHARISSSRADGTEYDVHSSGDLAGFEAREDAIALRNPGRNNGWKCALARSFVVKHA